MKTTDQDTILIKQAIRDHAHDCRLFRQLRKLPHNRQEWAAGKTHTDYRFKGTWQAGWVLCKIRSQQNGRIHHRFDPAVDDRLEALQSQLSYIKSGLHHLPDDVMAAAERALAKVQWRVERRPYPQRHCRHRTNFAATGAHCCYCGGVANPDTVCHSSIDPDPLI
jgi:hypothetical protein